MDTGLHACRGAGKPYPLRSPLLGRAEAFVFPQVSDYLHALDDANPAVNLALLVGRSSLRLNVMREPLQRPATAAEITEMSEMLRRARSHFPSQVRGSGKLRTERGNP